MIYIYIYKYLIYIYTYIYIYETNIVQMKIIYIFLQKDAHQFTGNLASPELSVRVDFEG